jgi:hypothetical protein
LWSAAILLQSGYPQQLAPGVLEIDAELAEFDEQILPSTWSYVELVLVGRTVRRTVSGNIRVGDAFMRQLLREFNGDVRLALAGWYQRPASVRRLGPLPTARIFVADVLALRQRFS